MPTPDELRNAFIKSRGLNLTSNPVVAPPPIAIPPPTPVQTIPITPTPTDPTAEPIRMPPPEAVQAWRNGANRDIAAGDTNLPPAVVSPDAAVVAAPPARVPSAFPVGGADPIVATKPVVEQGAGGGISLNSTPVSPGWAGTVGIPTSPEESKWWEKGAKNAEMMAGLEAMAKGAKPKPAGDSGANTITPMSSLQPNAPGQLSSDLMQSIIQNRRRKYGISLAG
jgi:hypothetical protein